MKITAEFNSNEELLSFISTFGARNFTTGQAVNSVNLVVGGIKEPIAAGKTENKNTSKTESPKEDKKEDVPKEETKVNENISGAKEDKAPKEEASQNEETEITKEMVRAIFSKLIKAGKQKEAKEITKKYGADKLPDLAEEHYAAAYKDVEGLL